MTVIGYLHEPNGLFPVGHAALSYFPKSLYIWTYSCPLPVKKDPDSMTEQTRWDEPDLC